MKNSYFIFLYILFTTIISCKEPVEIIPTPNLPFPQHTEYVGTYIMPDGYSQEVIDEHVMTFYDKWKNKYLKNGCIEEQYYVYFDDANIITVSEGMGYGMMITCIMAGYDDNAKTYFDGLFNFFKAHPSSINPNLMAWQQIDGCETNPDGGDDSASDGDIDIAYSLLLAHKQWGSTGEINYLAEAKTLINAIMQDEINHETWTIKLGDWSNIDEPDYYYSTRPSDFIIDHFRAFELVSTDNNWTNIIDTCYSLIENMQTNFSSQTGLIPDFIINTNTQASPANANFLEGDYDGNFYYNSCRVPWRLTTDYLLYGDIRAKNAIYKINNWLISETGNNAANIHAGYLLDGTTIGNYNDICFQGAFTVSAMLSDNQLWFNNIYNEMLSQNINENDYFGNTLKMLYLITISRNYWTY